MEVCMMKAKTVYAAGAVVVTPSPIREGRVCSASPQHWLPAKTRADELLCYFFLSSVCSDSKQRHGTEVCGRMKLFPGGEVSPAGCQRRNVGYASSQQRRAY